MSFSPIAIVGRDVVLPGALGPEALGDAVLAGRDLLTPVPPGRWRLAPERALVVPGGPETDRSRTDRGGYVERFEQRFDPGRYPGLGLDRLDPSFSWLIDTARGAIADAGGPAPNTGSTRRRGRTVAVLGLLSFPSEAMARFAEEVWGLHPGKTDPRNRFMSGLPALLLREALGLDDAFALDAACASSLYAVKLACDALHEGRADLALAGGVNRADDLFLHVGFTALGALSKTGRSQPFSADADGLVPAEGAGFVALCRLEDALSEGRPIHGVIRGIGLANDGRGRGLLAPSSDGQVRAMQAAFRMSGLEPSQIGLVECHATGTPVGDGVELDSLAQVYGATPIAIGSVKSNLGHPVTAAGMAGLVKLLEGFRRGAALPTRPVEALHPALRTGPFRLALEPFEAPARAALSAFGFGGNDAHLLLEAPNQNPPRMKTRPFAPKAAIVGIGVIAGDRAGKKAVLASLRGRAPAHPRTEHIDLALAGLCFPPKDLSEGHAQHVAVLAALQDALHDAPIDASGHRVGVFIGMGCDPEVARWGARWRLPPDDPRRELAPALSAAAVVGTMPNMPANRISSLLDLGGPSFTVSAEERSGLVALELGVRALAREEIDLAVVGAVDLSDEPVHRAALLALGDERPPGDAAVVLLLTRPNEAPRTWATVELGGEGPVAPPVTEASFGRSHAAAALLEVAAHALLGPGGPVVVEGTDQLGGRQRVRVLAETTPAISAPPARPLRFVAHPPPVPPAADQKPISKDSPTMTDDRAPRPMASPPPLPPVLGAARTEPPRWTPTEPPRRTQAEAASSPAPERASFAAPAPSSSEAPREAATLLAEQGARVAAAHTALLRMQTELHERFLSTRTRALEILASVAETRASSGEPEPRFGPAFGLRPPPPAAHTERARPMSSAPMAPAPMAPAPIARTPAPPPTVLARPVAPAAVARPPVAAPPPPAAPVESPPKGKRGAVEAEPVPSPTPVRKTPTGPRFDREGLKIHASGRISELFGPRFAVQDDFRRQVRMPEPPLLLADRVTGLSAELGSMGTGVIWTETDVREDAWYLHEGRMPAGVMIEAGQADLMLISWLGCDFDNRGERIYRLLGCDLTYHGGLPEPGDTIEYEIHVDGHAELGPVRIFFFHYDGWIRGERRISVRGGQAGFFTDAELAESGGILWDPRVEIPGPGRVDPPRIEVAPRSFSAEAVAAFSAGDGRACFGPAFSRLACHTRTPKICSGRMVFFDEVEQLDPTGGPWGRGYLRARRSIMPDDWFFEGHFKDDPCMPGTLMFEGCLQTMAFYLAGLGFTLDRDGWRFEPVPDKAYRLRCRGQVTPAARELLYELFVEELFDEDQPTLVAHLLCTVDGLPAFHAARMGLRLVPDWPLDRVAKAELAASPFPGAQAAAEAGGVRFDLDAMLACAWGKPSRAFGSMYARFDPGRKVPRLPGPPYHFMSRVVSVPPAAMGAFEPGAEVVVEYDVPPDAWYFADGSTGHMPFSVLLEAALQPCGWLASYVGSTLQVEEDLFFRNLDGTGTVFAEVGPDAGILSTTARLERVSKTGSMIIVAFSVRCRLSDRPVYALDTVFGFFPEASLRSQAGLPAPEPQRQLLERPGEAVPKDRLPGLSVGRLALLDRIDGWWPNEGRAGLGALRARMGVDAGQWFFAAHFFQDPVQPGSLGVEAMLDALRAAARLRAGPGGRFEVVATGATHKWKYRGQVVPENERVEVTLEVTADAVDERGRRFEAVASLWVDGKRIYEAEGLALRLVEDPEPRKEPAPKSSENGRARSIPVDAKGGAAQVRFDPEQDRWLLDHRPTWTVPAVPMMVLVDRLAAAVGGPPVRLEDVRLRGWVRVDRPRILTVRREGDRVGLFDEAGAVVVDAKVAEATPRPAPLSAGPTEPRRLPYAEGELFHGPSFQVMTEWRLGPSGASAALSRAHASGAPVPRSATDPLLLDGGTHAIPHAELHRWSEDLPPGRVAYPARLTSIELWEAPPASGRSEVVACLAGLPAGPDFPFFALQWTSEGRVWAQAQLVEVSLPKGPIGEAPPASRRAFLEGRYVPDVGIGRRDGEDTVLAEEDVATSDWLPGTVESVYGTTDPAKIIAFEHRARRHRLHPRNLDRKLPCTHDPLELVRDGRRLRVRSTGESRLDLTTVERFWSGWFDRPPWPVEDLYYGLLERFVGRVIIDDPESFASLRGRAALFLANHQTMVESLLFSIVASALLERPTLTIAKAEHRESWLGHLIHHCFSYPGVKDPGVITFFDRDDKASLPGLISSLAGGLAAHERAVMVHVEGTRALFAGHRVEKMSGAFVDLALATNVAVVPVRFAGGLPELPLAERIDFPVGYGRQDIWLGRPILAEELAALPYGPRKARVLAALEALGGPREAERPIMPDPAFAARVRAHRSGRGLDEAHAVLLEILLSLSVPRAEGTRRLVSAARGAPLELGPSAEDQWLAELARRLRIEPTPTRRALR